MTSFLALLQKELREAFRDRRAMIAAMAIAFMAPLVIYGATQTMIKQAVSLPDVYLAISGAEHAPQLMAYLARNNLHHMSEANDEDLAVWEQRNIRLTIPESYRTDMESGQPVELLLRADYTEQAQKAPIRRLRSAVDAYAQSIGMQRLLMRGIDTRLLQPITLSQQDTAPPDNNTGFITLMLVLYLMLAAFMSGLSVAVDSSAGERERQVLELLLSQPVATSQVVLAKLAVASLISALGVTLTLLLSALVIPLIDLAKLGLAFTLDVQTGLRLLAVLLPLCVFAAALQLFVAFFSRSFKEAQSTVSMVMMLPALAPIALSFITERPPVLSWLPITGQYILLESLFKGAEVSVQENLVTAACTLLICALLVWLLARRLRSQKAILSLG
jgi:sodium transport system permease protein